MQATRAALAGAAEPGSWTPGSTAVQVDLRGPGRRLRWRPLHGALRLLVEAASGERASTDRRRRIRQLVFEVEPGFDGLLLSTDAGEAALLPGDPVTHGLLTPRVRGRARKLRTLLLGLSDVAAGDNRAWSRRGARLSRFRTFTFGRTEPDGPPVVMQRGNVVEVGTPTIDELRVGLARASSWLASRAGPDGSFEYGYALHADAGLEGYNAVRHAGAVAGLYELHQATGDPALLAGARHGHAWIRARLARPDGAPPDLLALVDDEGVARSGAAGFALLALLLEPDGLPARADELEGLGAFLLAMTGSDGRVTTSWGEPGAEHPWFPGIVLLALAEAHTRTGDARWLEAAERIAGAERLADPSRPAPSHWTMQGLLVLHRITGEPTWARAVLASADRYLAEQIPPRSARFPDEAGGFRRPDDLPRAIRAASRAEALGAAVLAAEALGEDPAPYEDALLAAARHVLVNQYRPESSWYLPRPERAIGCMRLGLMDARCRIDANKHAARGLLRAAEVLGTR